MSGVSRRFGPFVLDCGSGTLARGGKPVVLGGRGAALLRALIEAGGEAVDKTALMQAAWPGAVVEDSNLTVQIAALRRSLGVRPDGIEWVVTVPRVGYRLVTPRRGDTDPAENGKPSVAVLPFANLSGDPQQVFFCDAIVDDLITALSRFRNLSVVARNSSFVYRVRSVDVRRIGEELGVRYVIDGSVRRNGNSLRLNAQLIETARGEHLWAQRFDAKLDDVFDAEDQIIASVLAVLEPQIRKNEITRAFRKRPENLNAYDLYLRALPLLSSRSAEDADQAIVLLDRSVELDPGYSTALITASLAHTHRLLWGRAAPDRVDDVGVALELMERAVAADEDDATVFAISACELTYLKGDFDRALMHCHRALALNPNDHLVVTHVSKSFRHLGMGDESIGLLEHALSLSPAAPNRDAWLLDIGDAHLMAGRFDEALDWALRSRGDHRQIDLRDKILGATLALLGRGAEARAAIARVNAARPGQTIKSMLGPRTAQPSDRSWIQGLVKAGIPRS